MTTEFPQLRLPKRYEDLEREARERNTDLGQIVQRVDAAATRIEALARQVRDGGIGVFEIFLGASGSGKTTFFRTLHIFFKNIDVHEIPANISLEEVADFVRMRHISTSINPQVWVLYDRDNASIDRFHAKQFFETLRVLFREVAGKIVLIWPITDTETTETLSSAAWTIGRDSIVNVITKGIYKFTGVPKEQFESIADLTTRNISPGQSLETFGLIHEVVQPILEESETISEFYSRLEHKSSEVNALYRDILKDRTIPKVWIVVAGDRNQELNLTVANLTTGNEKLVDIDRIIDYLDDPDSEAAYLTEWKSRRAQIAFLMRRFDVRLFELPPNVALAAIRLHGDTVASAPLKLKSTNRKAAVDLISRTAFVRLLTESDRARNATLPPTDDQTAYEYRRIQAIAKGHDKRFNKALAQLVGDSLTEKGIKSQVSSEKRAEGGNLKPDIHITLENGSIICIEPTWRTTGKEVPGEIDEKQNTLSVGHIQKYLLKKVLDYVNDFGM
jgi:hypothetical protein